MFQLVKKFFTRQSSKSGNYSDNGPKGSFHRFGQLPQEIQNLIWAYALCVDAPRACFVDVRKLANNPRILEIAHSVPESLGNFPRPPASNPKASDLVIVERWCHGSDRVSGFHGAENYWPHWRYMTYDGLRGIRRVAIPVDENLDYADDSRYLACVKAVFPDTQTLYFYMQPAQLVPLKKRHEGIPNFLTAQPWPGDEIFRTRSRIFYEIDPWEMRRAGIDTDDYVEPRQRERWRWKRKGIACIKFITWQWIQ
ncbi:uncharacterized protein FFNC_02036 [Fusarium fujikuroi]|nr:uncharacterized protein FFE2_06132 [Fusarium fujikuroi]SCO31344.1 uncharacterized protein FFNC_02036 [Fusarium fujikuroi]